MTRIARPWRDQATPFRMTRGDYVREIAAILGQVVALLFIFASIIYALPVVATGFGWVR